MNPLHPDLRQYHLEKDLGLPKITLQRWLREHQSHGDKCEAAAALISRWTRYYTAKEIKVMLRLGTQPYRGFKGMTPRVQKALAPSIVAERKAIVTRVLSILSK